MKINKVHCFFEQSGTFRDEFKNLGVDAENYDISNDFKKTDHIIDLFGEIEKAYEGQESIFDDIEKDDLIVAFFPCVRFQCNIPLAFRGEQTQQKKWSLEKKLLYSMTLHEELHKLYMVICKLFLVCLRGGYRVIIENPETQPHYLTMFFPAKPTLIDKDRTKNGDYFKKPTQYWFVNCNPENNLVFEPLEYVQTFKVDTEGKLDNGGKTRQMKRSLIHPQYARRFIKQYILDEV